MIKHSVALAGALLVVSASGTAQMVAPAAPASPMIVGGSNASMLRTGTEVVLKTSEELTTNGKKLRVGHRFRMEVAEPVMLNGVVVIPAGSPVTGEVTDVRNKGMWGKSGRINARVLYTQVNGRQIRLSGMVDDKGKTGTAGVVGAVAFVPVAGFFVTGTSANIPLGTTVKGFLDEDVPVVMDAGAAAAAPLVVTPAAPVPMTVSAPATTFR